MSTMEKLFVQIFERKKRIVDQVKQQTILFDQYLASQCLLQGIEPPPWLFSHEVHPSNKGAIHLVSPQFRVNDAGGASSCVQKPDSMAAASPLDQRDGAMLDVSPTRAQSLARIQRSKSRQRALQLRNSAKAVQSNLHDENNTGAFASAITGSEIVTLHHDHVHKLELVESFDINNKNCEAEAAEAKLGDFTSKEKEFNKEKLISELPLPGLNSANSYSSGDHVPNYKEAIISENEELPAGLSTEVHALCKGFVAADGQSDLNEFAVNDTGCASNGVLKLDSGVTSPPCQRKMRRSDIDPGPLQKLARVQRSKSQQQAIEPCDGAKATKNTSNENNISVYSNVVTGSGIASVRSDQVHESEIVKTVGCDNEICEMEKAKLSCSQSKEKGTDICSDRITDTVSASSGLMEDETSKSNISGSKLDKMDHMENCVTGGFKSSPAVNSSQQLEHVQELELIKPVDVNCERYVVEEPKVDDFWDKEKNSHIYCGRITRSQSSNQQISCTRDSLDVSNSSSEKKEDETSKSNVSESTLDKMDHMESCVTRGSKSSPVVNSSQQLKHVRKLELIKPVDVNCERSVVEEPKVDDFLDKEKSSHIYYGRITRSQSSNQQISCTRDSLVVSNSSSETKEDETSKSNVSGSTLDKMDHMENHVTGGSKSSPVVNSSQQLKHVHELELIKSDDVNCERSVVEEPKVEKSSHIYSGRITRSQSSNQQISSTRDSLDVSNSSSETKVGDLWKKENGSKSYSGRITRFRNSSQQATATRDSLNVSSSCTQRSWCDNQNAGSSKLIQQIRKNSVLAGGSSSGFESSSPQFKRKKIGGQLNDSLSGSASLRGEGDAKSNVSKNLVVEVAQNGGCHMLGGSQSSPKLQVDEDELCLEENTNAQSPFTFVEEESKLSISSLANQAIGDSKGCSDVEAGVADPISVVPDLSKQCTGGENAGYYLAESPHRQSMELVGADLAMPEFEGFIMQKCNEPPCTGENANFDKLNLTKSIVERASLLEELCKSASMHTPISHFSTTYKLQGAPNLHNSVPNGLLESMDLGTSLLMNDDASKQIKVSGLNEEVTFAFEGRSYSDCFPSSSAQSAWDIRKPLSSPAGGLWDRITLNSGSSEKRGSLNPELSCIKEENENTQEAADVCQDGMCSEVMPFSVKREALADITEDPNLPASVSKDEIFAARNGTESAKKVYSLTGTCNRVKQKLGHHNSSKEQHANKVKISNSLSVVESGITRLRESVHSRFGKPKLSGKPSLRKGGPSVAEKETKCNNIVSSLTSFIPLVQQKQQAAIITGKRDVKVKALEAAEAAKRLAQEKENERKMRKEALKLERARLGQENLKQLELQKKKKEEERKKKEAEIAARKRQREEEERKEKERKRKRVFEAQKQQRGNEEKLCGKKENEVKGQSMDERVNKMKVSRDETGKDNKMGKEIGDGNLAKMLKTEPMGTVISASDARKEVSETLTGCGDNSKVICNLDKVTKNDNPSTQEYQEESYLISPYKSSDDEDEDDDDDHIPNSKFIPSWASRSNVAAVISSQKSLNPESIFPPKSFCSIAQVLQRHKTKRLLRK